MTYKAYYYLLASGKSPLETYLKRIKDARTIVAIERLIERLIGSECRLPSNFVKPVNGKIYELRLAQFSNQYRVFYFIFERGKVILLDGYTKKTDRIPSRILKRIQFYYSDFLTHKHARIYLRENS